MKPFFIFCFGAVLLAQDAAPGWHRFGESNNGQVNQSSTSASPPQQPYSGQQPPPIQQGPIDLTIAPGTWVTARVNEPISTNHSQPGDAFMATLAQPIVVNGLVVARRGQTIQGRVAEVVKAGRVKGVSRLGIELTELSLVDGQQVPLKTQLVERSGGTSVGNDVGAIGLTTGVGAAIGAAAGGGWGAGIGALAGAAAGTTGVLTTRGRETIVYPEQVLTFRLEAPIHIASAASGAFQPGSPSEYDRSPQFTQARRPVYAPYPAYSPYGFGYGGFGYPYFGSFGGYFYSGPRFYYGRGSYRRF